MSKKKHKATDTKVLTEPRFIRFSELQRSFLSEMRTKQVKEWNEALESVYRDLGIMDKIIEAPPGTYQLRQRDLSGLDFRPVPQASPPPPIDEEEEKRKAEAKKKAEEEAKGKKSH